MDEDSSEGGNPAIVFLTSENPYTMQRFLEITQENYPRSVLIDYLELVDGDDKSDERQQFMGRLKLAVKILIYKETGSQVILIKNCPLPVSDSFRRLEEYNAYSIWFGFGESPEEWKMQFDKFQKIKSTFYDDVLHILDALTKPIQFIGRDYDTGYSCQYS